MLKTVAAFLSKRLVRQWCEPKRVRYVARRPHLVRVVLQTTTQHETKEGAKVERRNKQPPAGDGKLVPVMLKYSALEDRRRWYPYASTRQNTRSQRGQVQAMALAA